MHLQIKFSDFHIYMYYKRENFVCHITIERLLLCCQCLCVNQPRESSIKIKSNFWHFKQR